MSTQVYCPCVYFYYYYHYYYVCSLKLLVTSFLGTRLCQNILLIWVMSVMLAVLVGPCYSDNGRYSQSANEAKIPSAGSHREFRIAKLEQIWTKAHRTVGAAKAVSWQGLHRVSRNLFVICSGC
uniref:Uncharacterized protein n=1 Tax=Eptatretus burgeri TaxID=7764 RepID=A0A8C4Q1I2_EPTBU